MGSIDLDASSEFQIDIINFTLSIRSATELPDSNVYCDHWQCRPPLKQLGPEFPDDTKYSKYPKIRYLYLPKLK